MGVAVTVTETDGLQVAPGKEAARDIRIRNTGAVVDSFELDVLGEASSWATVTPSQLNLMPGDEGAATVVFSPPRSPQVLAGEIPYAVRIMSREDTAGSRVEEGSITVGPFSQVVADIVPRTSYGRFSGRHELAVDNLGNHPELATVSASDPDRLLDLRVHPANVTLEPGTATFVKVKAKPKKTFWIGPNKTIPFTVVVSGVDAEQQAVQGSLLQQPILPPWFFKALAVVIALVIALAALWFAFLKPAVESTAQSVAEDHTEDLAEAIKDGNERAAAAEEAAADAEEAAKEADETSTETEKDVKKIQKDAAPDDPSSKKPSGGTLDSASAIDFRITTSVAPAGGYEPFAQEVEENKVVWVSDIVLQNPSGDLGTLRIQRGDQILFEFGLENFRDLDYHLIQPVEFTDEDDVVVAVDCENVDTDCSPSVYFTGRVTKVPKQERQEEAG